MYPKSTDPQIQLITDVLVRDFHNQGVNFCIEGNDLFLEETASFFGCLTLLVIPAKENYEKVFNQNYNAEDLLDSLKGSNIINFHDSGLVNTQKDTTLKPITKKFPITFVENKEAFFNIEPIFTEESNFSVLIHFIHHGVSEYINYYKNNPNLLVDLGEKGKRIPLDPLLSKFKQILANRSIDIIPENKRSMVQNLQKN